MHIEYYIKELRNEKGYSTEKLHQKANVSVGYINKIEKGLIKEPSLFKMEKLAKALSVPLSKLYKITW